MTKNLVFYEPPSSSPCVRFFSVSLTSSAWDKESPPRVSRPVPRFATAGEAGNRAAPDSDQKPKCSFAHLPSRSVPPLASVRAGGFVESSAPSGRCRLLYVLIIRNDQSQDNSTSCDARSQGGRARPSDPRLPSGM